MKTDLQKIIRHWLKQNKKQLKEKFCSTEMYPSKDSPITIFMAGTPGAGKTEFSKSLIAGFKSPMCRIDADEIRELMRDIGYDGSNSMLYQSGVTDVVSNLYASCIKNKQDVLVDGTFAYANWRQSIEQSKIAKRNIEIFYLYQDPQVAWSFVKEREKKLGRHVPVDVFVNGYINSIKNVEAAKKLYGDRLTVYFAKNNYQKKVEYIKVDAKNIADLLPKVYNDSELRKYISDK